MQSYINLSGLPKTEVFLLFLLTMLWLRSIIVLLLFLSLPDKVLMAQSSGEKPTRFKIFWHDFTARYNGYFNARIKIQEGLKKLEAAHKDDFSQVLTLEADGQNDAQVARQAYPLMDDVIKKASLVIQRRKYTRLQDECYFLVGQAYYLKQDYFSAKSNFMYTYTHFPEARSKALAWLLRNSIRLKEDLGAEQYFNQLTATPDLKGGDKRTTYLVQLAISDWYIFRSDWEKAQQSLVLAIGSAPNRDQAIRLRYILAQVQERAAAPKKALDSYKYVVRKNPPYALSFNARLAMANLYSQENLGDTRYIKEELKAMLRDDKNKDYRDKIHYALGNLEEADENYPGALEYYTLSCANSAGGKSKGKAHLARAGILDTRLGQYSAAALQYDSALIYLEPASNPEYKDLKKRRDLLIQLYNHRQVVSTQDSLQYLAALPEPQLLEVLRKMARDQIQESENSTLYQNQDLSKDMLQSNTTWYFANATLVAQGYSEFVSIWGNRANEDFWRYSQKNKANTDLGQGNQLDPDEARELLVKKWLSKLPKDSISLAHSDSLILNALMEISSLYAYRLKNYPTGLAYLDTVVYRYPLGDHVPEVLYRKHLLYNKMEQAQKADEFKMRIFNEYPLSEYARLLRTSDNPTALAGLEEYQNLYGLFHDKKNQQFLSERGFFLENFPSHIYVPQVQYMHAQVLGRMYGRDSLLSALNRIVNQYHGTELAQRASEEWELLNKIQQDQENALLNQGVTKNFKHEESGQWLALILFEKKGINLNPFKIELSKFNSAYFGLQNLKIEQEYLNMNTVWILVRTFTNVPDGLNYVQSIQPSFIKEHTGLEQDYWLGIISPGNLEALRNTGALQEYKQFHRMNWGR